MHAHKHIANHRPELERSSVCGCFHCLNVFTPDKIDEWTDELDGRGTTAICPKCGVDSVLGDASGFPIETEFLKSMRRVWFPT